MKAVKGRLEHQKSGMLCFAQACGEKAECSGVELELREMAVSLWFFLIFLICHSPLCVIAFLLNSFGSPPA